MEKYNKKLAKRAPLVFLLGLVALGTYTHDYGYEVIGSLIMFAAIIAFVILGGPEHFFGDIVE